VTEQVQTLKRRSSPFMDAAAADAAAHVYPRDGAGVLQQSVHVPKGQISGAMARIIYPQGMLWQCDVTDQQQAQNSSMSSICCCVPHLCAVNKAAGREHRQELRRCVLAAKFGRVICDRHTRPLQVRRGFGLELQGRCAALLLA
jgi:hypothetical protein